ncbi:RAD52 family DNA repair protein [Skeletonema marinoi]|uniref:RAD52 family DNA repair protein n=1 Tax=Skeletonema marinoi TaxID=267567 RepID=A0AAD9D900_9STRA|nr:RAD52 family DNA repair protein [Skeletonema marinoi]
MNSPHNDDTNITQHNPPLHEEPSPAQLTDSTNEPMKNYDGSQMRDTNSQLVYKSQFLSTHPLWSDCKERVGYGGKKFTYVSGDGVIRNMNAIFGHGGWSSQILNEKLIQSEKDDRGRWYVGYLATVRVTLLNGASHEDCGSGEGFNDSKIKAHEKAIKSAVTDAMKRAARHFGERLGNALYVKGNGIRTAPRTNRDALAELERKDSLNLFGNQAALRSVEEKKVASTATPPINNHDAIRTAVAATMTVSAGAATARTNSLPNQNHNSSHNTNTNRTSMHSGRPLPPPAPSPIVSRGPLHQQLKQQQPQLQGVANANNFGGNQNNNIYLRHQQQQQQPQQRPTSQMAPPPRPMYNPANNEAGTTAYQLLNKQQQQQVTVNNTTANDTSKRGLNNGGDDSTIKRQKLNPYSNNNNSRLSV